MNQPIDPGDESLEARVARLEAERAELLSMTKEVIRLSQIQTFNTQQVTAMVGRVEVGLGTVLERLDHVEQSLAKLDRIETAQASHSERFDGQDAMLREILARLPEKDK